MSEIIQEQDNNPGPYQGQILYQEPLASYTTWRVGGLAKQMYKPMNIDDLAIFLKQLSKTEPVIFLGLGSNSLIKDTGFSGTIVLTQGCLMDMALMDDAQTIRVEAGVSCATMARFCARNHLVGAEFLAGIPGTIGGALRMNAGCSGSETWKWVQEVETISRQGERRIRKPHSFDIAYRHVHGLDDEYFVAGTFRFEKGDKETSLQLIKKLLAHRAETQPTNEYNCGSVFRNPEGDFAARLIEACGLKGHQCGKAMVSSKHANFIINQDGFATASDIESLITLVQDTVLAKTQIKLVREVHIIGDE
jgi:UDP-N-acetylmuramate dehydrogenase